MLKASIINFSCNRMDEPSALLPEDVNFSYGISSDTRGIFQKSYRITVGSKKGENDLWDSGVCEDSETVDIDYKGLPLKAGEKYFCCAEALVSDGKEDIFLRSDEICFRMALTENELCAKWIEDSYEGVISSPYRAGYLSAVSDRANDTKWVKVDLGEVKSFDSVILYGFRPHDLPNINDFPGYAFPLRYRITVSENEDMSDGKVIRDESCSDFPNPGIQPVYTECAEIRGRYILVEALLLDQFRTDEYAFALSQIEVMDNTKNLALGCKVTAKDECVGLGEAYGAQKLTDGEIIWHTEGPAIQNRQPYFRKSFSLDKVPEEAMLYYSAHGLCEVYINRKNVEKNAYLLPGLTDYDSFIEYRAVDVSSLLKAGKNEISAQTADGWYAGRIGMINVFGPQTLRSKYGRKTALYAQLRMRTESGINEILSDESWESTLDMPLRSSDIYDGEYYDARYLPENAAFRPVIVAEDTKADMLPMKADPVSAYEELSPINSRVFENGHILLDFGKVTAGTVRLKLKGEAGKLITLRYSEALKENGEPYYANMRGAIVRDRYIPATDGFEEYEPKFTYHGFRYLEIFSSSSKVAAKDAVCISLSSCPEETGKYEY
ncbi:MAG: hypothetical protein E7623_06370, partial [Ruminococcaceae bacterium]|nr:hypothetical protein [Oscillospiraceae bacterium]